MATTKKKMTAAELRVKLRELGATPTMAKGSVQAYTVPTGGHIKATAQADGTFMVEAIGCKC